MPRTPIATNAAGVIKSLEKIITSDIPFAASRAMGITVGEAVHAAETEFERYVRTQGQSLDPDDSPVAQLAKKGPGKGAIRGRWPSKRDLQNPSKAPDALVYVVNTTRNRGRFDLVDELHPLVFGGTTTSVPDSARSVITPTTAVLEGLKGRGRLKKLNNFGNIAGLKRGIIKELSQGSKEYLNVPINNSNIRTKHLKPGLYFRGREISKGGLLKAGFRNDGGRLSRSGNKGVVPKGLYRTAVGARGRSKRKTGRVVNYLVMLLAYHTRREHEANFNFPFVVLETYRKRFPAHLSEQIIKAIAT